MQLHHRLNHQSEYSLLLPNFLPTPFQAFRLSLVAKLHILFEMSCIVGNSLVGIGYPQV